MSVCVSLPGQLIEMFRNIEELKEELRAIGMSNASIDKLLAIPIPDNRAEVRVRLDVGAVWRGCCSNVLIYKASGSCMGIGSSFHTNAKRNLNLK